MEFADPIEAQEVAGEFRERARELRAEAETADPSHGQMLKTLARDYDRRAMRLEMYAESRRDPPRAPLHGPTHRN
jgi:hypothetical protein